LDSRLHALLSEENFIDEQETLRFQSEVRCFVGMEAQHGQNLTRDQMGGVRHTVEERYPSSILELFGWTPAEVYPEETRRAGVTVVVD
jgi:hypothetical protein